LKAGNICAELFINGRTHLCPLEIFDPHVQSDIALLLFKLPSGLSLKIGKIVPLDSDNIPYGTDVVSAGFNQDDLKMPSGPRGMVIGKGPANESMTINRNGAPVYDLSTPSFPGMSGGPIFRMNRQGGMEPAASGVISKGGHHGSDDTIAISVYALYSRKWDPPVWGAKSFLDLLSSKQVWDQGKDRHDIQVIFNDDGSVLTRRQLRIERGDRPILIVPPWRR